MRHPHLALLTAVLLTATLSACGTATTAVTPAPVPVVTPVTSAFTGTVDGTLSALSDNSFTVGTQLITLQGFQTQSIGAQATTTEVQVNGEASAPGVLAAGQHVQVDVINGVAKTVNVLIEVRGTLEAVDLSANTISVAGQTVTLNASTRISLGDKESRNDDPNHTLSDLAALKDPFVDVTGSRQSDNTILAKRIEVRTPAQKDALRLQSAEIAGTISALNTASKTFVVNGVNVNYANAIVNGTPVLQAGVEVRGTYDGQTKTINAARVNVRSEGDAHPPTPVTPGANIIIEGKLTGSDTPNFTVTLGGYTIDVKTAKIENGPVLPASHVRVEGTIDKTNPKLVHARVLRVLASSEDARYEGTVSGTEGRMFDLSTTTGTVRVDASAATTEGTVTSGQRAVVYGSYDTQRKIVIATRVLALQSRTIEGTIRDLNTSTSTFRLGDATVNYAKATLSGTPADGKGVRVVGTLSTESGKTVLNASLVTVK